MKYLGGGWTMTGTQEYLEKEIGNGFKVRIGWTETLTDTVYCEAISDTNPIIYHVIVWNEAGVRGKIAAIVDKPAHVER